jgi:hypothetical protein
MPVDGAAGRQLVHAEAGVNRADAAVDQLRLPVAAAMTVENNGRVKRVFLEPSNVMHTIDS